MDLVGNPLNPVKARKQPTRVTIQERLKAIAEYHNGASIDQLAELYNVLPTTIVNWLQREEFLKNAPLEVVVVKMRKNTPPLKKRMRLSNPSDLGVNLNTEVEESIKDEALFNDGLEENNCDGANSSGSQTESGQSNESSLNELQDAVEKVRSIINGRSTSNTNKDIVITNNDGKWYYNNQDLFVKETDGTGTRGANSANNCQPSSKNARDPGNTADAFKVYSDASEYEVPSMESIFADNDAIAQTERADLPPEMTVETSPLSAKKNLNSGQDNHHDSQVEVNPLNLLQVSMGLEDESNEIEFVSEERTPTNAARVPMKSLHRYPKEIKFLILKKLLAGETQAGLARAMGINAHTINNWKRDKNLLIAFYNEGKAKEEILAKPNFITETLGFSHCTDGNAVFPTTEIKQEAIESYEEENSFNHFLDGNVNNGLYEELLERENSLGRQQADANTPEELTETSSSSEKETGNQEPLICRRVDRNSSGKPVAVVNISEKEFMILKEKQVVKTGVTEQKETSPVIDEITMNQDEQFEPMDIEPSPLEKMQSTVRESQVEEMQQVLQTSVNEIQEATMDFSEAESEGRGGMLADESDDESEAEGRVNEESENNQVEEIQRTNEDLLANKKDPVQDSEDITQNSPSANPCSSQKARFKLIRFVDGKLPVEKIAKELDLSTEIVSRWNWNQSTVGNGQQPETSQSWCPVDPMKRNLKTRSRANVPIVQISKSGRQEGNEI